MRLGDQALGLSKRCCVAPRQLLANFRICSFSAFICVHLRPISGFNVPVSEEKNIWPQMNADKTKGAAIRRSRVAHAIRRQCPK